MQEQVGDTLGGSKKDSELRRQEILGEGPSSFAGLLCKACKSNAADMLRDPQACDVIVEVAQAGSSGISAVNCVRYSAKVYLLSYSLKSQESLVVLCNMLSVMMNSAAAASLIAARQLLLSVDHSPLVDTKNT